MSHYVMFHITGKICHHSQQISFTSLSSFFIIILFHSSRHITPRRVTPRHDTSRHTHTSCKPNGHELQAFISFHPYAFHPYAFISFIRTDHSKKVNCQPSFGAALTSIDFIFFFRSSFFPSPPPILVLTFTASLHTFIP